MASKRVFITGISGTGKSTVLQRLSENGIKTIDVDHVSGLCGWVKNETGERVFVDDVTDEFMESHDYKCDMKKLEALMTNTEPVVVCGCVGDNNDFLPLFDVVILFQCEPETLIGRLTNRNTNPFGKDEKVQDRILDWRLTFDKLMLEKGAIPINSEQPIDKVVEEVMQYIK